jgi:chemotaxis family two-component system sensor kinase Cph1
MSPSEARLPPGELQRLAECVLEPIRFPAAIQPHGAFIAVDAQTFVITHVSDNTRAQIGADPVALLGRPLSDLLDSVTLEGINAVLSAASDANNPSTAEINGRTFDVISHHVGPAIFVELEPRLGADLPAIMSTRDVMRRMATADTITGLWSDAVDGVRKITGYDRVMVYHFYPDGHGQVVGEARAEEMEPYLGLHYPASDIPEQARQLYLTKRSRLIGNSGIPSAALLSDANSVSAADLDLSVAELRAVSPHHLEFMRNMGQVSTFSLSLIRNGVLVGMITCAHRTERHLSYFLRDGLELLANQLALQLGAMMEIEGLIQRDGTRQIRSTLVSQLVGNDDIASGLIDGHVTLLDFIPADGAAIRLNGQLRTIGAVPDAEVLERLRSLVETAGGGADFANDALPLEFPELAAAMPQVAGLLTRQIGHDGDYIAWFRGEIRHSINWLGDMSPENRQTPLSPRNSFSAWREEVSGTSSPWEWLESEARELGRDIASALLNLAESRLAEQALRDPLTGLPNRRLLMDRLEQSIARHARGQDVALLFVDIDQFKKINDTFGHGAGDDALLHVAHALTAAARGEDTVARLGGDEFIVLCEGVSSESAHGLAERVRGAVAEAPAGDAPWRVSVSIGVAMAGFDLDASQLLSAADAAMYRAKVAGRNQISS